MVADEMKNRDNTSENVYSAVFAVADYKSAIIFLKFKMADSKCRPLK